MLTCLCLLFHFGATLNAVDNLRTPPWTRYVGVVPVPRCCSLRSSDQDWTGLDLRINTNRTKSSTPSPACSVPGYGSLVPATSEKDADLLSLAPLIIVPKAASPLSKKLTAYFLVVES